MVEPLGTKIRRLRLRHDLTQTELAGRAGVSTACVCHLENGERNVRIPVAQALAKAFGLSLESLLDGTAGGLASPTRRGPRRPVEEKR